MRLPRLSAAVLTLLALGAASTCDAIHPARSTSLRRTLPTRDLLGPAGGLGDARLGRELGQVPAPILTWDEGWGPVVDTPPDVNPEPVLPGQDTDGDGIRVPLDNCPMAWNPHQGDADGDGVGDACDGCWLLPDDQLDDDGDGLGNACDPCPLDPSLQCSSGGGCACPPGATCDDDADGDGVRNACDNCPLAGNVTQSDLDRDGIGDACDPCPTAPGLADCPGAEDRCHPSRPCTDDRDGDGVRDHADLCPDRADALQVDLDGDGRGDACDPCPDDPSADCSGDCLCVSCWDDRDGDGTKDGCDRCPDDPACQ